MKKHIRLPIVSLLTHCCILMGLLLLLSAPEKVYAMATTEEVATVSANGQVTPYAVTGGNIYFNMDTGTITDCDMSVTKAIIPSSINGIAVVKIGDLAFSPDEDETSLLETVAVPCGITELGVGAFSKCENMHEVSLPSTLEFMDIGAFYDCEGVWNIYYAGTEKQFQDIQHRGKNSLWNAEYHFTDGMREGNCSTLGSNVRWELDDAGTLKISGSGSIRDYCTYGMTDLPPWIAYKTEIFHVVICDGVNGVGTFAFHECYYIQDVAIPKSVEYISTAAFEECDSLSKVFYEGTERQWDKIEFDPRNDEIHSANLVYEQAPQVSSDTIQTGKCGKSIRWSLYTNGVLSIYGSGEMDSYGPYWSEETAPWYSYKNEIQSIVIDAGITSIGANAFSNLSKVTSISIPATVTWIRYGAFSDCTNLKTIYIPENVSTIQSQAFLGCTHLEKIEVDAKNRYYYSIDGVLFVRFLEEENDFYAGNWLWLYPSAKADADYCIPNDVVAIDGAAFMYCGNLETITIPLSVNDISWDAFWECPNLTTITILNPDVHVGTFFDYGPDADHAVEYSVFFYCDNITDVFFSGSESQWYAATIGFWDYEWGLGKWATTGLPDDARIRFDYNPNLLASGYCGKNEGNLSWTLNKDGTLDIHGNGPMVDFNSFVDTPWTQYADVIKRLVVGDGVTSLGDNAFTGCNNISEITIPGSVTYIGAYSFSSCTSLKSVNLPYGVAIIGEHAFSFSGVTYIYLPLSLVRIDYAAFGFCENLAKADYEGTKKQWRTVAIADENSKLIGLLPNTESREMGIGTLEYVFEPVIVINEQTYLIPSAYYESMSELLANKKVSDKRVVYEVVDDEIESIYSIYDVINVGIDFQKANEIVFKDGSYNQENVDVTICASIISPSGSSIYDSSQLRSLGSSLSVSFSTLELKSLSELMNFGKGGFLGLQTLTDKAYDLNSVTISGYGVSTLIGTYSVHVESTMEPTDISTEVKIRAGLSCSGNEKSYYNVTSILFGNLDLQEQQAQENKRSRLEQEKYEKLKSVLENINTSITLDPVLLNFFSMKQVEDMEKIVAVYVSEVIAAQEIDTGTLFQQLTSKVRKRIREKVMDKLGTPDIGADSIRCTATIEAETKSGKTATVDFDISILRETWKESAYAALISLDISIHEKGGSSANGNGVMTYINLKTFADQVLDYIKSAYTEAWGSDVNKVASMYVSKITYILGDLLLDEPSDNIFKLLRKPSEDYINKAKISKRGIIKCPVDVYVLDASGDICAQIVNNSVRVENSSVFCSVVDDDKYVYLLGDDYSLVLVGNDYGTMEYVVEEYANDELVRTVSTADVPLTAGKTYNSLIPDIPWVDSSVYTLSPVLVEFKDGGIQVIEAVADTVINTISRDGSTVTVEISCDDANAMLFCGIYKNNGQMVSVDSYQVAESQIYNFQFAGQHFDYAKVFVLDSDCHPLCESKRS